MPNKKKMFLPEIHSALLPYHLLVALIDEYMNTNVNPEPKATLPFSLDVNPYTVCTGMCSLILQMKNRVFNKAGTGT
jgi:hypothetical protein